MSDHEALRALIHDRKSKKGAGRISRTLNLCLDGDLAEAHDRAVAELAAARERIDNWHASRARDAASDQPQRGDRRFGAKAEPPAEMVAELEAAEKAEQEAAAAKAPVTVQVVLTGIPNTEWDELVAANPKREGHAGDEEMGANWPAFLADLFNACAVRIEHNSEPLTDIDPADLFAGLSPGEFATVEAGLMVVCKRQVSVSFSDAASQRNRPGAGKSRRHLN